MSTFKSLFLFESNPSNNIRKRLIQCRACFLYTFWVSWNVMMAIGIENSVWEPVARYRTRFGNQLQDTELCLGTSYKIGNSVWEPVTR